ncbi:MAG: hypothetical protein ACRDGI_10035 [Candidatus Limnocylindrales bacterium]
MDRTLAPLRSGSHVRIWTPPDWPWGAIEAGGVAVEWTGGSPGHPSSFGLLGGRLSPGTSRILVPSDGPRFYEGHNGNADRATFGLPSEYSAWILKVVPEGLTITTAAAGVASSSPLVFMFLARALAAFLRDGIPIEDDAVRAVILGAVDWVVASPFYGSPKREA